MVNALTGGEINDIFVLHACKKYTFDSQSRGRLLGQM